MRHLVTSKCENSDSWRGTRHSCAARGQRVITHTLLIPLGEKTQSHGARGACPARAETVPAQYLWGQAGWRRSASSAWERRSGTGEGQNTERGGKRRARGEFSGHGSSGSCYTAACRGGAPQPEKFLRKLYCINLMPAPGLSWIQRKVRLDRQNTCLMDTLHGSQAKQTQYHWKLSFTLKKYC